MTKIPAVWIPAIRSNSGADVFNERLAHELKKRGIRAEITWLPLRAEYLPWTVHKIAPPEWANIAHLNSWLPHKFWPHNLPTVVSLHHLVHDPAFAPYRTPLQGIYHRLLIHPREKKSIQRANIVITGTSYVKNTITAFTGNKKEIKIIPYWIDTDFFQPGLSPLPKTASNNFKIFIAGNISKRKGSDLLEGFAKELGDGFEIRYAGGPSTSSINIQGITELGRISKQQLVQEYQQCDAVVSLSRYEGFGYTAAEALSCNKPFLGFSTSALPEVVDSQVGVLVPINDIKSLAAELHTLKSQGTDRFSSGRKIAIEKFSIKNVDTYVDLYTSIISNKKQS